jgi:hypothetical protein
MKKLWLMIITVSCCLSINSSSSVKDLNNSLTNKKTPNNTHKENEDTIAQAHRVVLESCFTEISNITDQENLAELLIKCSQDKWLNIIKENNLAENDDQALQLANPMANHTAMLLFNGMLKNLIKESKDA